MGQLVARLWEAGHAWDKLPGAWMGGQPLPKEPSRLDSVKGAMHAAQVLAWQALTISFPPSVPCSLHP